MAPPFATFICRLVARITVKHVIPLSGSHDLPALTQTWVVKLAEDGFPIILIALVLSALVAAPGFFVLFSKRLSADKSASVLLIVCCVAYSAALIFMGSTMLALVLPFLQTAAAV